MDKKCEVPYTKRFGKKCRKPFSINLAVKLEFNQCLYCYFECNSIDDKWLNDLKIDISNKNEDELKKQLIFLNYWESGFDPGHQVGRISMSSSNYGAVFNNLFTTLACVVAILIGIYTTLAEAIKTNVFTQMASLALLVMGLYVYFVLIARIDDTASNKRVDKFVSKNQFVKIYKNTVIEELDKRGKKYS